MCCVPLLRNKRCHLVIFLTISLISSIAIVTGIVISFTVDRKIGLIIICCGICVLFLSLLIIISGKMCCQKKYFPIFIDEVQHVPYVNYCTCSLHDQCYQKIEHPYLNYKQPTPYVPHTTNVTNVPTTDVIHIKSTSLADFPYGSMKGNSSISVPIQARPPVR